LQQKILAQLGPGNTCGAEGLRVFWSRNSDEDIGSYEKQVRGIKVYTEGRRRKNLESYEKAIITLMDGNKISVQRIADYMGKSRKQVSRYRKDERNKDLMAGYDLIIKKYNNSLRTEP